jgi:hypothetical protein
LKQTKAFYNWEKKIRFTHTSLFSLSKKSNTKMLHGLHLFENLHIHSKHDEQSEYAHVPKYTPTILKKLQNDEGHHHHHHHIYHLHRGNSVDSEKEDEGSLFVPESGTEKRGIFRTMEPIWVCTVDAAPRHSKEANQNGMIILDNDSQKVLESAFKTKNTTCDLSIDSTTGLCTVEFSYDGQNSTTTTTTDNNIRHFSYGTDIQRMTTPVWWYEKKGTTGKKELCRFDWKNQMRLESFGDDESTLSLTDKAFAEPFTVALNSYNERQQNEWQGFVYLDTVPRLGKDEETTDDEDDYRDLNIQGKDNFPNFNAFTGEDEEEVEEEAYRKAHIKHQ